MNAPKFWMVIPALLVAGAVGMVNAKLPTPPMDDKAKAAAEDKKAKAEVAAKKGADDLAKAQDRAVSNYKKEHTVKAGATAPKKK